MHLKLVIQYDGTDFSGSQLQAEGKGRTVQGELEGAVARIAGEAVRVALAGRTDSGVHAWGQVASLDFPERARLDTPESVRRALNAVLPPDLGITSAEVAPPEFHARFSARKRAYRYLLWNAQERLPLLSRYSLHVKQRLDVEAMSRAASLLVGTHDLAAFAGQGMGVPGGEEDKPSTVRTVYVVKLTRLDERASFWAWDAPQAEGISMAGRLLALDLVANAFLPQMIRNIAGTLLEVGAGKRPIDDITRIIESRDRREAGQTARPHGLCLLWVEY